MEYCKNNFNCNWDNFNTMEGLTKMPYKSLSNIIAVWILNGISWLFAFSTSDWLQGLSIVKEIFAIISLIVAIAFTLYKFRQSWRGWNPRKKK